MSEEYYYSGNNPAGKSRIYIFNKDNTGLFIAAAYIIIMLPLSLVLHIAGSYLITSENDFFSSYLPHAERLLKGHFIIDVYRGPLYVFLLAGVKSLTNNYLSAGIIISSVSSGIVLFFIYRLLQKIFSEKAAVTCAVIIASNPFFITYSYAPGTDMFFCALCSASVYFFLSAGSNFKRNVIWAGVFAGLAFLTRYNSIFIPLSVLLIILFNNPLFITSRQKVKAGLLFFIVFIALVLPWGIYTYDEKGEIFYNENYRNVAISLVTKNETNWEDAWNRNSDKYHSLAGIIEEDPVLLLSTSGTNFLNHMVKDLFTLNTVPSGMLIISGLLFFRLKKVKPLQASFYIFGVIFFILLLPLFYDPRFSLYLLPLFSILCYFGLKKLSFNSFKVFTVLLMVFLAYNLYMAIDYNKNIIKGESELKETARSFYSHEKQKLKWDNTRVASRMPHISYQLNMRWNEIPYSGNLSAVIKELKKQSVSYLYISTREILERKQVSALADPAAASKELMPVVYLPRIPAVLYKIK